MNPSAAEFVPKWIKTPPAIPRKARLTKAELKALQAPALRTVACGPRVTVPPFHGIPLSLAHYLQQRNYIEWIDVDAATALVADSSIAAPVMSVPDEVHPPVEDPAVNYFCVQCSHGPHPCQALSEIIKGVRRRQQQTLLGAFLFQQGHVVMGLVQLQLVFESKKSSMRMRSLKEHCPAAVQLIKEYLCGDGFHIPSPSVTAHDQWRTLNQLLKFDAIRDSKTLVYTELSKYWKKSHTQFEQFAHFLFYRDDVPAHRTKNMITHAQKPIIVAVLSGDLDAVVMLSELGYFVPPDYYWSFPLFKDSLRDPRVYGVLRHLCVYYYQKQSERGDHSFHPISPPSQRRTPDEFHPKNAFEALTGVPHA